MKIKYVIIDGCMPVIFGEYLKHSDFLKMGKITSAGFVTIREVESRYDVTPYGESISLNLKPAQHDKFLIEKLLN